MNNNIDRDHSMTFVVPYIDDPITCESCGKINAFDGVYYACNHYLCIKCFDSLVELVGKDCSREEAIAATENFIKEKGPVV